MADEKTSKQQAPGESGADMSGAGKVTVSDELKQAMGDNPRGYVIGDGSEQDADTDTEAMVSSAPDTPDQEPGNRGIGGVDPDRDQEDTGASVETTAAGNPEPKKSAKGKNG